MTSKLLISPAQLKAEIALTSEDKVFIQQSRSSVVQHLIGVSPHSRLLIITGPCSIHNVEYAKEYAQKFKELASKVQDTIHLVMRVYAEKPRSRIGWKGILYDPNIDGSHNLEKGIRLTRQLYLDITKMNVPIAAELLNPLTYLYIEDMISWACIGARTTLSQIHREMGSALSMSIGFKNDTDGGVEGVITSIIAADTEHCYVGISPEGMIAMCTSTGNPFAHIILRGGKNKTNYDHESVAMVVESLSKSGLLPRFLIDCAHDNCEKDVKNVSKVFKNVLQQILEGDQHIAGMMFESYLEEGNQPKLSNPAHYNPKVSITDPCLSWEATQELILETHELLLTHRKSDLKRIA